MAFVHPTRTIAEDLLPNTLGFGNDPGPNRLVVITIASQVRTTLYVADRRVSAWRTRRISRLLTLGRVQLLCRPWGAPVSPRDISLSWGNWASAKTRRS